MSELATIKQNNSTNAFMHTTMSAKARRLNCKKRVIIKSATKLEITGIATNWYSWLEDPLTVSPPPKSGRYRNEIIAVGSRLLILMSV